MAKVFDFQGGSPSTDNHYLLIKPARFQSLPSGREWKLEEKGILEFTNRVGKDSLAKSLHKSIQNNQTNTNLEISKIHQELNDIKSQLPQISPQGDWQAPMSEIRDDLANTNLEILKINRQLNDNINSHLEQLESQVSKISLLRDYVYLQIDLLKVRLESLESKSSRD